MKILHFCNLCPNKVGAFERLLINLGRVIKENGDVSIICVAGKPIERIMDLLREVGVKWYVNEKWSDGKGNEHPWQFCLPALRLILREKPTLVAISFGNELPCVIVRICTWFLGLKKCKWVWIQQQQICDPNWLTRYLSRIRILGWFFDHITVVYEAGKRSILLRGIPLSNVSTVYNGSSNPEVTKTKGWLRTELGVSSDSVVIVCTSWLIERKRIDFLLKAFAELVRNNYGKSQTIKNMNYPVLILVGDGPLRKQLESLTVELKIDKWVHFLGLRNDVNDILQEADMFTLSSMAEACANAILEAMAFSLPVVTTDVGASREQIVDGVSGYVVACDDFRGFVEALGKLESDAGLRHKMGAEAQKRWEQGFSSIKSAQNHYALWRRLVGSE